MKIIKMILKNFIILLTSIVIAAAVLAGSCTSVVFNKDEVKKVVNKSGVYKKMNDAARDIAIEALNEVIKEVNKEYEINLVIDAKDLIGNIDISDMFELITDEIIEVAYSKDEPKIVINYLTNRYLEKLDEYLEKNKIELPVEVNKTIHDALGKDSLDKIIDDTEVSKALKEVQKAHIEIEKTANVGVLALLIVAAIPTLLIIILCKKKVKEIVKLLAFSSIILIGVEVFVRSGVNSISNEAGELALSLFNSAITLLFDKVHMVLIGMIALILILIAIKILAVKTPEEKADEEQRKKEIEAKLAEENKKIKDDGTVVSAFDKF